MHRVGGQADESKGLLIIIDDMGRGRSGDRMRVEQRGSFPGLGQADAQGTAGDAGKKARAQEALEIEDEIISALSQFFDKGAEFGESGTGEAAAEFASVKEKDFINSLDTIENGGQFGADHPGDMSARAGLPQGRQDGQGMDDVAEGGGLDDQNPPGPIRC